MKASPLSVSLDSRLHTFADTHRPISAKLFMKSCKERETWKHTSVHPMELLAPPLFTSWLLSGNAKKNLRWAQQNRADQPDRSASTDRGLPSVLCCQRSYVLYYTMVLWRLHLAFMSHAICTHPCTWVGISSKCCVCVWVWVCLCVVSGRREKANACNLC